ncbi:hypothetical protein MMC30_007940 [Trapelia coarctata]|nr:hypothetical protein [Trapelia coarctata]
MAEVFGESLLSEIKVETLDELLHSLRELDDPHPGARLSVPVLNDVLSIFTSPPVRQQELHQRWGTPPPPQHVPFGRKIKPPVIEICGTSPGSGKAQLLYHIAATSLYTPVSDASASCQKSGAVIWIDTDSRFDINRLHAILRSGIQTPDDDLETTKENTIEATLQHLHIFRPQSSDTLLATLYSIPSYLFSLHKHYSGGRPLRVLIISNISAFLHQDRLDSDIARDAPPSDAPGTSAQPPSILFTQRYRDIVTALRDIQTTFSCTIVAGNISLSPLQASSLGPTHRPHLPGAWTSFCATKIFVARKIVPRFGFSLSAEEAELERAARRLAVERSGFRGWVDPWRSEAWEIDVREAVERNEGFNFQVDGLGVHFAEDERSV